MQIADLSENSFFFRVNRSLRIILTQFSPFPSSQKIVQIPVDYYIPQILFYVLNGGFHTVIQELYLVTSAILQIFKHTEKRGKCMTRQYSIRAPDPDRGETLQTCPICRKETKEGDKSCPGCGYKFPLNTRRSRLHQDPLISFPRSGDSGTGKEMIFL
jgi:hypothetical protein